jgi:uncharacterized protein (DUF58 family)
MPTTRTTVAFFVAGVLWLFAIGTQTGWLYAMSALLVGLVFAGWWLNRSALRGVELIRDIKQDEVYEGDEVTIRLAVRNPRRRPQWQIAFIESCAIDDPETRERACFVPNVPLRSAATIEYNVPAHRRGLHTFPAIPLHSRAPFGFFKRARTVDTVPPTRVLVYPELRTLNRLDLLDQRTAPQMARPSAGVGSEVIGTRPYRTGDSPRHIHWRSVARTGQLISREFADEAQPGLVIVLDLHGNNIPDTKHTPFEWSVKIAASIADYAHKRGYPLHLHADSGAFPAPSGALSRTAVLQYLARVQPTGSQRLSDVLGAALPHSLAAITIPDPDPALAGALISVKRRGVRVLATLLDAESFPTGGRSAEPLAAELRSAGIEVKVIRFGENWAESVSE